jgi:hypothetical protein
MVRIGDDQTSPMIEWASRVNPAVTRRLYDTDARSIVDEEQIDDVGYAPYWRCQSIIAATEARDGCRREWFRSILRRGPEPRARPERLQRNWHGLRTGCRPSAASAAPGWLGGRMARANGTDIPR